MRGGVARRGGPTNRPSPGGSSSRPMVARPVRYGPVRQKTNFPLRTSQSQPQTGHSTHARTGPDTQRAQAHNHTQNSNSRTHPRQTSRSHAHTHLPNGERCPSTDDTAPHHSHTHTATPTRERARQWNHRSIACASSTDGPTPTDQPLPHETQYRRALALRSSRSVY